MKFRGRWLIVVGVMSVLTLLSLTLLIGPLNVFARQNTSPVSGWTTVFADTFTTGAPLWTVSDTTGGLYQWGTAPYLLDMGSVFVADSGFWAAGGGSTGSAQTWPTGTYTNSMTTLAIAGPFTPTQEVWDMQVQLTLDNRIAAGDAVFVGLSDDGVHFEGITITEASTVWLPVQWSTEAFVESEAVWIGLRFSSDAQTVDAGPMVDNVQLAFNYGTKTYLPLISRILPTPTVVPLQPFIDDFGSSDSGWYTGPALRYNEWCRYTYFDCHEGWEVVANMSYYNGNYRIEIPLTWHGGGDVDTWFVWPAMASPMSSAYYPLPDRYCIEASGRFANWLDQDYQPYWAHWGIVFGGNESGSEVYSFQVNANHDYAVLQHHNYIYPGNRQPLSGEEVNVEIPLRNWHTDIPYLISTHNYNRLKVVVNGDYVDIYVNDHHLGTVDTGDLPHNRVGLIGGSWEVTPIDIMIDYFKYDPYCPEVQ